MSKFLFTLLMIAGGTGVGLALVCGVFRYRMFRLTGRMAQLPYIILTAGIAVTQGVLVIRLGQIGDVGDVSWFAWAYALGLLLTTVGLAWQSRDLIVRLAAAENGGKK